MRQKPFCIAVVVAAGIIFRVPDCAAGIPVSDPEFDRILSMDIADLVVTSPAKHEQKLTDAPAAIYVITQEDMRRAGVFSIPEALRLAPGMQVARVASNQWAISARGFNGTLSNKLLVLIDGRTIYTPVFSGTYWDDQSTLIQDIDRIEVIRGPGSTLWGANAMDGVINIITKPASETQGNLVSATGSLRGGLLEGRHGGKLDDRTYYRTYAQYLNAGHSKNLAGGSNGDDWSRERAGFRIDGERLNGDNYTLQGDAYGGRQETWQRVFAPTAPLFQRVLTNDTSYGGNILGRWTRALADDSKISVQAYLDHYSRLEATNDQHVTTADVQLQHNLRLNDRNNFTWGAGGRYYFEDIVGSFSVSVNERYAGHHIVNAFAQDEYALVPDTLYLTAGSKFEHNDFTGFEVEPSARLSWHPTDNQTVWAAVSRAVRTPSSIENDVDIAFSIANLPPVTVARLLGNPHQQSEELIAYELGHRIQPTKNVSFDTALFYNDYSKLLTAGPQGTGYFAPDGTFVLPYTVSNQGFGHTYGVELTANWNVTPDWRLAGSYTFLKMDVDEPLGTTPTIEGNESLAPRHQFNVQSYYNVSNSVHWDNMIYYVDGLASPVDAYVRYDTRIAWRIRSGVEISLIGKNLIGGDHAEFPTTTQAEIGRSIIGQVQWKF